MILRPLRAGDEVTVRRWLTDFLSQHQQWWAAGYGRAPRATLPELVEREWQDLQVAAASERRLVTVLEDTPVSGALSSGTEPSAAREGDERVRGLVQAGVRADRTLGFQIGVLQWIYVDPGGRGRGLADALMRCALAWMDDQGVSGREVFVTALNPAAVRLYCRHGFEVADHRMLAAAPGHRP